MGTEMRLTVPWVRVSVCKRDRQSEKENSGPLTAESEESGERESKRERKSKKQRQRER